MSARRHRCHGAWRPLSPGPSAASCWSGNGLDYLQTIAFILVIAALVQLLETVSARSSFRPLYEALGVYLPLITTNCAVLGVTILNMDEGYNLPGEPSCCAVGAGLGFLLAMVLFSGVRRRVEERQTSRSALRVCPSRWSAAAIVGIELHGLRRPGGKYLRRIRRECDEPYS